MIPSPSELTWPVERLGDALVALAEAAQLPLLETDLPTAPPGLIGDSNVPLERWIEAAAEALGIESELVEVPVRDLPRLVAACAPAVVRASSTGTQFLLVLRSGPRTVDVLGPDLRVHRLATSRVCECLIENESAPFAALSAKASAGLGLRGKHARRVREAILAEGFRASLIRRCWHLRIAPGARFPELLRRAGVRRLLTLFAGGHVTGYALLLLAWWTVGRGAFDDRADPGWLAAFVLLLATWLPLRVLSNWAAGMLALEVGRLCKVRMLAGALALEPDEIRSRGVGQLLTPVIEADELEAAALQGGLGALTATVELTFAGCLLAMSTGGPGALALAISVAVGALIVHRYQRARVAWSDERFAMTHALIERILGHRTRLCQERLDRWHETEDASLARYIARSRELDSVATQLLALLARGFLLLSILAIAPGFVSGESAPPQLAVALGSALLGYRALQSAGSSLMQLAGAAVAWRAVQPLHRAAARREPPAPAAVARQAEASQERAEPDTLLEGFKLGYRHAGRDTPALQQCDLTIRRGDTLLLEGPSGSGKSTLVSLLSGLRAPADGVLLAAGLDRRSLGLLGWRRQVAAAPQFQDNHILQGTFAFNLLMSRNWPPRPGDLEAAEDLCHELGLGELLSRMPAGMQQALGETGWRLSHGERSRLFIARALLSGAPLVMLDESLAALDPETLQRVGRCVVERAPSLLVIAHP